MKHSLNDRLLHREFGEFRRYSNIRGIYGDRTWIKDLDIVNELDGHNGCVNALSWSKSGNLLASGSDDTHLNIHVYQPESSTSPFRLATTVSTGHSANIFSVKFMPHSNDRTLVTVAGDRQVRIFDIEYSAGSTALSSTAYYASTSRAQGFLSHGIQHLSEADTNTRVYRCHGDRVKRIVTESSPHLFLTCSEDGEVRQWDLRQPSSAYPKSRGHRSWRSTTEDEDTGIPPPLISYKRWQLDINTISCSASRPHYIALGGAHLHCFLHDRRMLGRDRNSEKGSLGSSSSISERYDDVMGEATQCVKRFAPDGQRRMKRTDNGHITSCKISDANPNEMIVSWSGEWIYNFNLLHSPDARETANQPRTSNVQGQGTRNRQSNDRKRKRTKQGSPMSQEGAGRANSKSRRTSALATTVSDEVALRVRYENGQSESIPIRGRQIAENSEAGSSDAIISLPQQQSYRFAKMSVTLRKHMFDLGEAEANSGQNPTGHSRSFTSVLGLCASSLDDMDNMMRTWRYPVDPDEFEVAFQKTLRLDRESARRFVQASGTLARVLGGKLQTVGSSQSHILGSFVNVVPVPNELSIEDSSQCFSYDFIKAICLWLDSGPGALVEGFTRHSYRYRNHPRFPIADGAGIEAIDEILIPYLLRLASTRPMVNINASRFEVDVNRLTFPSEHAAVLAFANAVKIPFQDLLCTSVSDPVGGRAESDMEHVTAQDRKTALRFWAFNVARSALMNAGEGVNFELIDRAFGGLGQSNTQIEEDERLLNERFERIDADEAGPRVTSIRIERIRDTMNGDDRVIQNSSRQDFEDDVIAIDHHQMLEVEANDLEDHDDTNDEDRGNNGTVVDEDNDNDDDDDDDDDEDEDEDEDDEGAGDDDDDDNEDEDADGDFEDPQDAYGDDDDEDGTNFSQLLYRSSFERSAIREQVHADVPCATHTRHYRGHCNVKTVKDVNFFGLQDEYVVSGSDSGHLFIWDSNTCELLNILEGDGETVNVIQGHPYEPMLAVSGIDHTIKIFSPDSRARRDARHGVGVAAVDPSDFSSLSYGRRSFGMRRPRRTGNEADMAEDMRNGTMASTAADFNSDDTDLEPPPAPTGLKSKKRMHLEYQITSQNNVDRQGGNSDAVLSRAMLAQIAARMRAQRQNAGEAGATEDAGGEGYTIQGMPVVRMGPGGPVIVNTDTCSIM